MTLTKLQLLYVEDHLADYRLLGAHLKKGGLSEFFEISHVLTVQDAFRFLEEHPPIDLILLDLSLPDSHGLEGLLSIQEKFPRLPVVVLTGNTDKSMALEAIKIGAQDYLIKGEFSVDLFYRVCNYAIERKKNLTQLNLAFQEVEALNANLSQTVAELQAEKKVVLKQNKQINSLLSIFIHDLRNPVNAIIALCELVLADQKYMTIPQLKYLNQIKHSSSSMLDNILAIISTTKIKEGSYSLEMSAENPYFTLNSAIDKYIIDAIQKNVIIVIGYRKDLPKIYFDKRLLVNTVSVYLEECLRICQENNRLQIECELLEGEKMKVVFEMRGVDASTEAVAALFDEPSGVAAEKEPTGFRLSDARRFVESMNGEAGVEPIANRKGIALWFTLRTA